MPCLAHLRQPQRKLKPEGGGATASSPTTAHAGAPGPRSLEDAMQVACSASFLPLESRCKSPPATLHSGPQLFRWHGSAQLFLVHQPIAKGQQCARRARGGAANAPPGPGRWARDAGPGPGGHAELKAPSHVAANPDHALPLPFIQKRLSPRFGFPKMLWYSKQRQKISLISFFSAAFYLTCWCIFSSVTMQRSKSYLCCCFIFTGAKTQRQGY